MPLYEFECTRCKKRFEKMLSIDRRDDAVCPWCGGNVKRVYQGKCAFGKKSGDGGCSGNCAGCQGCSH